MRHIRSPRLRAGFVTALTGTAALVGFFYNSPAAPAQTSVVTGGRASAYAVSAASTPVGPIPPTPDPNPNITVQVPPPEDCPDVEQGSLLDVVDTGALLIGAASAEARCNEEGTATSFFEAEADVAAVTLSQSVTLPTGGSIPVEILDIGAVHTECRADVNGMSSAVTVASIEGPLGAVQIPVGEITAQNGPIAVDPLISITLHEEVVTTNTERVINGLHLQVLPGGLTVPGLPVPVTLSAVDLIIGHVECARTLGQVTTTTTATTAPVTTATTTPGATTTTTLAAGTTTTLAPGVTTTTTVAAAGVTTPAQITTTTRVAGQLARTGADIRRAAVWAAVAIVLGLLMTMGRSGVEPALAGAKSFGPTAFPVDKRRRKKPASATRSTMDSAALDALIQMDGGDHKGKRKK